MPLSDPAYGYTIHLPDVLVPEARARIVQALADQGFGILTEIDVAATLRTKLGVEVPDYVILGACNPALAHQALQAEPGIGLLLPCNVCVWREAGQTVVSIAKPEAMFRIVGNDALQPIAAQASQRLQAALATLSAPG